MSFPLLILKKRQALIILLFSVVSISSFEFRTNSLEMLMLLSSALPFYTYLYFQYTFNLIDIWTTQWTSLDNYLHLFLDCCYVRDEKWFMAHFLLISDLSIILISCFFSYTTVLFLSILPVLDCMQTVLHTSLLYTVEWIRYNYFFYWSGSNKMIALTHLEMQSNKQYWYL